MQASITLLSGSFGILAYQIQDNSNDQVYAYANRAIYILHTEG